MGNILEPLVDSFIDLIKWGFSLGSNRKTFDFTNYFEIVGLCTVIDNKKIYPKLLGEADSTKGRVFNFSCPLGLSVDDFNKHKKGIEAQLGHEARISLINKCISIEVISKTLAARIDYKLPDRVKDSICIPFADSLDGVIFLDLKETPHTLCTGATGGGKSVTTRNIITSIVNLYPSEIELYLIDFKFVELSIFKNLKQTKAYVSEIHEAKVLLNDLMDECKRRYKLFEELGVNNIYDYNKSVPRDKMLKNQFIVIEEFIMLMEDKKKVAMSKLKQLSCMSRASGQFLYITAQRFDNTVIDLTLRSQIGNRICHKVESENDSKLIIDTIGAEKLAGNGHLLFKNNGTIKEAQSYYINDDEVRSLTNKHICKSKHTKKAQDVKNIPNNNTHFVKSNSLEATTETNTITDLSFLDNL